MDKELPTWLGKGEITGNPEVLLPWVWESRPTLKLASAAFNRGWATLYLHSWWLAHLWLWPLPSCSGPLKTETLLLEVKDTVPNNCQSLNRNTWKLALPTFSEWGRILYLNSKFFIQLLLWAKLLCHQNHCFGHGCGEFLALGMAAPRETGGSDISKPALNMLTKEREVEHLRCVCAQRN